MMNDSQKGGIIRAFNFLGLLAGWLFGGGCFLMGLAMLFDKEYTLTVSMFLAAGLLVPLVRRPIQNRLSDMPKVHYAVLSITLLLIFAPFIYGLGADTLLRADLQKDFEVHRTEMIAQLQTIPQSDKSADILTRAAKYTPLPDTEFQKLAASARQRWEARIDAEATTRLTADFKKNGASYTAQVKKLLRQKEYREAAALAHRYDRVSDPALKTLADQADAQYEQQQAMRARQMEEDASYGQISFIRHAKESVQAMLKDPDSAQFRNEYYHRANNLRVVCGEVNAKNGFGGYMGFKRFIFTATPDTAFLEGETPEFGKFWRRLCR